MYELVARWGRGGYSGALGQRPWVARITGWAWDDSGASCDARRVLEREFLEADQAERDRWGRHRYVLRLTWRLADGLYDTSIEGDRRYLVVEGGQAREVGRDEAWTLAGGRSPIEYAERLHALGARCDDGYILSAIEEVPFDQRETVEEIVAEVERLDCGDGAYSDAVAGHLRIYVAAASLAQLGDEDAIRAAADPREDAPEGVSDEVAAAVRLARWLPEHWRVRLVQLAVESLAGSRERAR